MKRFSILTSTSILSAARKSGMRRLAAIATSAVFLAAPVWAQRGGGGGGAGGHGGGLAGRPGTVVGRGTTSHSSGAPSRPNSSPMVSNRPFNRRGHSRGSSDRMQSGRFGRRRFPNCFGSGCWSWAWAYPWWGFPWWGGGYDADNDYDRDHERDYDSPDSRDRENFEDARMMPPWGAYGYPPPYAPPPPATPRSAAGQEQAGSPIIPATVLVFHDKHQQEVQNYAIVGQTLWNFAGQHIEKISLNELDLAATVKANHERGRSFRVPSTGRSANDPEPVQNNT